jgi:DNA-binding SARP family transcriptional activator/tetratricopeptide (TPR) repeat protein
MEGVICVRLLGTVEVERDGEPVRGFRSRKALAFLGYLAVQGQPVSRERLADLFWEGKAEARGRANLSWVVHRVSTLIPDCLQADRHSVRFVRIPACWVDTDAFDDLEVQGDPTSLAAAVALYRGQFLEGMTLKGCTEFELWLVGERERWHRRAASVLQELIGHHSQRGEYGQGARFAQRMLALEPWREEGHRQVMRFLSWSGQRGAALAQYKACRQVLAEVLDVEPALETTELYEQIRAGELEPPVSPPADLVGFSVEAPTFLEGEDEEEPIEEPVFVAREEELARLDGFLKGALGGGAKVVFVTGEAGQGKTMLMQQFVRHSLEAHPDLIVAGGNGNAYTGVGDPFLPFREVLALLTGDVEAVWTARAIPREQARRLWHLLPLAAQALMQEGLELIGTLLPGPALLARARAYAPDGADWLAGLEELVKHRASVPGTPSLQQSDLFEQYTRVLRALAQQRPLLLFLDDLQWVDGSSAGLLFHLGRRIEGSRVLIVGAYRPSEVALGQNEQPHPLTPIVGEFKRTFGETGIDLERAEGWRFVEGYLDAEPNWLGVSFRETFYRQTGGHPLFTVELLRGMQERGDLVKDEEGRWVEGGALDWETLPPRVEAVIGTRIGRLPEGLRRAVEVASVEGETFTAEVVAQVAATDGQEMVRRLSGELDRQHRLVRAQGLQRVGADRLSTYRFRHILFQRYLYQGLDPVERARLHEGVGVALERLYGSHTGDVAVELARHFEEAGIVEKAVEYLGQAGERAIRMSAHEEAVAHFRWGLALLEGLPESGDKERRLDRGQAELTLLVGLAASLQVVKGFSAPEVNPVLARARALCRRARETPQTPQLFRVLTLLVSLHAGRAEPRAACEVAQQLLELAEQTGGSVAIVAAHYALGWNLVTLGEFAQSRTHTEQAIAGYDPERHHSLTFLYGCDISVTARVFLAYTLWYLGYPEQAVRWNREALALAKEIAHPFSLAMALGISCAHYAACRDVKSVAELAQDCLRHKSGQGFPFWSDHGMFFGGWARAYQGQADEVIPEMQQVIAKARIAGIEAGHVLRLAILAEVYGKAGRAEEGLPLLEEALETSRRTGECIHDAEIHRLRGDLLLVQGGEAGAEAGFRDAEACFRRAIEVARGQSAKSWELRATTSLCRLWQRQGKYKRAHRELAAIYNWFTEGFDTADLREAQALLEELA